MLDGITRSENKWKLSKELKNTLAQANRKLTKMQGRAMSDGNVKNTLAMTHNDLAILTRGQSTRYAIPEGATQRQVEAIIRSAETLNQSPYSTVKGTEALYRRQRKALSKATGLNARQTKQLVDLFDEKKDSKTAQAWQKIKDEPIYIGLSKSITSSIGEQVQNIGSKKFGFMMRLYTEAGLQNDYNSFVDFLNDTEIQSFFANNTLETVGEFVNGKMWM